MARSKKKLEDSKNNLIRLQRLERILTQSSKQLRAQTGSQNDNILLRYPDDFQNNQVYFLDTHNQESVLISKEIFSEMLQILYSSFEENFCILLEQEIAEQMPYDFDDVWEIAIREARKNEDSWLFTNDPKQIVANIKKQNPHLFLQFKLKF
ncbi:hypothetical protein CCZ01_03765 [Helicobacter monodelphidis]|uniref:DUF2603 domain-containing protein n=1 Tax=Helicobacter sp. 15-1451 TaxID=2004995 RepID=UPI000DCDF97B|nr:DUF2603 domain-containing protein [Helicobacter sp. 15-1451]RAX58201.1 hypothetical protein CCZ01_03765 [Helicobacter sp. 15-1451]